MERTSASTNFFALLFLVLAALSAAVPASAAARLGGVPVLPFRADGYDSALAAAKARGLPVFVESWAPW